MKGPNFVCVGAARAGTTALWQWFARHDECYVPKLKETNFFVRERMGRSGPGDSASLPLIATAEEARRVEGLAALVTTPEAYETLYPDREACPLRGEFSPAYLYYADTASKAIAKALPGCRIVILLREPSARAWSNYKLQRSSGRESLSFPDALAAEDRRMRDGWEHFWAYRGLGCYAKALARYFEAFGRERVWVGLYERLVMDPAAVLGGLCDFLGIAFRTGISLARENASGRPAGVITRLSRSGPGYRARRLVPEALKRRIREADSRIELRRVRADDSIIRSLREGYTEEIAAVADLCPELEIPRYWKLIDAL